MSLLNPSITLVTNFGKDGLDFVTHATGAVQRLLPHVDVSDWEEGPRAQAGCVWTGPDRHQVRVTITFGTKSNPNAFSLRALVHRRNIPGGNAVASEIIDIREHQICDLIGRRVSELLTNSPTLLGDSASLKAIASEFDESIVSEHIQLRIPEPIDHPLQSLVTINSSQS